MCCKWFSGYVYYEEDCFHRLRNPYIPLQVDHPTMQQEYQRNLAGEGREQREEVCQIVNKYFDKLFNKKKVSEADDKDLEEYYKCLCGDIARERKRIGGDWAVAGVLLTRHHRDLVRSDTSKLI